MNVFRYYHQNRKFIWLVIIAIIILVIAIQAIDNIIENKRNQEENINNEINARDYKNNLNINILVSNEQVKNEENLAIDQFIRYCNAGKIQEAYNIISNICKEQLFPTIEEFKQNYYNIHFSTTKLYSKEIYIGKTYKVKLYEDILSTGDINSNSVEDYYTLEKEDNIIKLNISNYIGDKKINKTKADEDLHIEVIKKQIYKDYEEYEIEVENLTYKTILLDSKENTKTMNLKGKNSVLYYSLSHEIMIEDLIIRPKSSKTVFIKYNKEYNSNQEVNQLKFSDIILDYELYQTKEKKSEYKDRKMIFINL